MNNDLIVFFLLLKQKAYVCDKIPLIINFLRHLTLKKAKI